MADREALVRGFLRRQRKQPRRPPPRPARRVEEPETARREESDAYLTRRIPKGT